VFGGTYDLSSDFAPIDAVVKFFVDKAAYGNVVPSYQIEAMTDLRTWFRIVSRADDALNSVIKDYVGDLVARKESPNQRSAVHRDYEHFLCRACQLNSI
jgi:hypothetical protein